MIDHQATRLFFFFKLLWNRGSLLSYSLNSVLFLFQGIEDYYLVMLLRTNLFSSNIFWCVLGFVNHTVQKITSLQKLSRGVHIFLRVYLSFQKFSYLLSLVFIRSYLLYVFRLQVRTSISWSFRCGTNVFSSSMISSSAPLHALSYCSILRSSRSLYLNVSYFTYLC